ncbi:MAG TPA: helix-turn-helix domain-containing protein [Acidocella sp.]|uniref:helix-turn-helix domain-containing protein n=1 Tax=Acidocella sp. TaxID=50710 RepID=UPI002D10AE4B|nr:helix-turn-helix domain-containing protein [Acidocella sp.]HVE21965.1 helix-turn-helix domain-containing protein [Acidocella sp.]
MSTLSAPSFSPSSALLAAQFLQDDRQSFWDQQPGLAGTLISVAQDQGIYSEGDQATLFYKVVSGVVRTCKFLGDGRRQVDAFYLAGEVFGIEPGEAHRLAAEAAADCTLVAYRRRSLDSLSDGNEAVARHLFQFALQNAARAQDHALLLGHRSALEKLACFLLHWASRSTQQATVTLAVSRQDIADFLGLTIETVSRTLSKLEKDGVIKMPAARRVDLRNLGALRALTI